MTPYEMIRAQLSQAVPFANYVGVEVVEVSAEQRDAMRDAVLPPVLDFYLKNNGDRGAELLEMFQSQMGGS